MPILAGFAAGLMILLMLAAIGAVLLVSTVVIVTGRIVDRFRRQRTDWAWGDGLNEGPGGPQPAVIEVDDRDLTPDDFEEWVPIGWPFAGWATEPLTWSPMGQSTPETVTIEAGPKASATAVADKPTSQQTAASNQVLIIHTDHTMHWEDEASDCPLCRSGLD
jgi:hypothetical protein